MHLFQLPQLGEAPVTRLNLVPVEELMDQHLFAEFREIKMVPKSLRRSLQAAWQREFDKDDSNGASEQRKQKALVAVLAKVPTDYCLGEGHVSFFYNKATYLRLRFAAIREELMARGINFDKLAVLDSDKVFAGLDHRFERDYWPTHTALNLIRARIAERIALKPIWYRKTTVLP